PCEILQRCRSLSCLRRRHYCCEPIRSLRIRARIGFPYASDIRRPFPSVVTLEKRGGPMKPVLTSALLAAVLLAQGCSRSTPAATTAQIQSRTCLATIAAAAGDDAEIAKLQADLRDQRAPARAAEQLGYRFISKARLSNDPGFYTRAEQAAACLE